MTHQELVNIALYIHGAVLAASLGAWYKYGDRTDIFSKSLEGTESTLFKLRMMIANDLLTTIEKVKKDPLTVKPNLLGPNGQNIYWEKEANFIESEGFRQAIRDFLDLKIDMISNYRVLMRARSNWCYWARILSWSILIIIILQMLSLAMHGFIDKILEIPLPSWCIHGSLTITVFLVLFLFCFPFRIMLRSHDLIIQEKVKYDAP